MKTKTNEEITNYAQMGMTALLPGMVHMLDMMQRQIDSFRAQLNGGAQIEHKRERPRKNADIKLPSNRGRSGWSDDPAERAAEMRRRQAVARAKKATHPRDPNHPGHAEWVEKIGKVQRERWKKMTKTQKADRLAKMKAGHDKPQVKLAVAS